MSSQSSLMRPLRSDSLKPRPSTQAVWDPSEALHTYEVPELPVFTPAKAEPAAEPLAQPIEMPPEPPAQQPAAAETLVASAGQQAETETPPASLDHLIASLLSEEATPEEKPVPAEHGGTLDNAIASILSPECEAEEPPKVESSLSDRIASILSADDSDDEDDSPSARDALPTRDMPTPACVPLYEQPAPPRRKKGWLWLLPAALLAGGLYAAWHLGYLSISINLP